MDDIPTISTETFISTPLILRFNEIELSTGTGFFYEKSNKLYLITNWHNITGRNYRTKKLLSPTGGVPNNLICKFYKEVGDEFSFFNVNLNLYNEKSGNPSWLIHPILGNNVDIIALEILGINDCKCMPINSLELEFEKPISKAGDDVFILGFPFSINQNGVFPIWKRGTIASEPELDFNNEPIILVDSASRSGMSGSPVISQRNGIFIKTGIGVKKYRGFLGIYSGRLSEDTPFDAQLGIIWKSYLIDEIIDGQRVEEPFLLFK